MAVTVTIASVVFVGMTALLVGFIMIAQKNRKEVEDSSVESMSNQYIFQCNQSIITIRHDEMTKISKFYIVSDTSVTRPTIECEEVQDELAA